MGISVLQGTNSNGAETVGPWLVTEDFACSSSVHPFICGVVYRDSNDNSFYDLGEGLGSVTVRVAGVEATGISSSSGAYAVPISTDGSYSVTFSRSDLPTYSDDAVITDGKNTKLDYVWDGSGPIPVIQQQPESSTNNAGTEVSISSTVASDSTLYIQWTKDGSDISGATSQTLVINAAKSTDAGEYAFTASNMYGKVSSEAATLKVIPSTTSQSFRLATDTSTNIVLNDYFDLSVTYDLIEDVAHGELTGEPPNLTYTPATKYTGSDSFSYVTYNGSLTSLPATIQFTVGGKNNLTPIIFLLMD